MKRLLLGAIAIVAVVGSTLGVVGGGVASAHAGNQSYLYLDITDTFTGRLQMPFNDVEDHLGLKLSGSEAEVAAEIAANADLLWQYTRDHVSLGVDGQPWEMTFDAVERLEGGSTYLQVGFDIGLAADEVPQVFTVGLDPFLDEDASRDALLLIGNAWERGYVENEANHLLRFTADNRVQTVDLGDSSGWKNFTASIELGIDHIKTGPDHILFVTVLLLPSVLVFANRWRPAPNFGSALWRVLKVVTMFTVAHSITFSLAGLGILPVPSSRIIESVIALSIAAAALHNIRPIMPDREWVIAFSFGLFHGLGFASLVSELDVSKTAQMISLGGRNVGIEIGQSVVVLLVFPSLFLLRRTSIYERFFVLGSAALVVVSIGWMGERLFDAPAITTRVLNQVLLWPRVLLLIAAFTAVAAVVHVVEQRRGRLLPVHAEPPLDSRPQVERAVEDVVLEPVD